MVSGRRSRRRAIVDDAEQRPLADVDDGAIVRVEVEVAHVLERLEGQVAGTSEPGVERVEDMGVGAATVIQFDVGDGPLRGRVFVGEEVEVDARRARADAFERHPDDLGERDGGALMRDARP